MTRQRGESATGVATAAPGRREVRPGSQETCPRPAMKTPRGKGGPDALIHTPARGARLRARRLVQYTSPATVKTDPKARCFGPGTGGTGKRVKIPSPTALGLVADALPHVPALRPLSLTDHFAFGLGVCGIGGRLGGDPAPFWDLTRDEVTTSVGGDQVSSRYSP